MDDWGSWSDRGKSVVQTAEGTLQQPSSLHKNLSSSIAAPEAMPGAIDDWESLLNNSGQVQHATRPPSHPSRPSSVKSYSRLPATQQQAQASKPAAQSVRNMTPRSAISAAELADASAKPHKSLTGTDDASVKMMPPPFKRPQPSARHALLTAGKANPTTGGMLATKPSPSGTNDVTKPAPLTPASAATAKPKPAAVNDDPGRTVGSPTDPADPAAITQGRPKQVPAAAQCGVAAAAAAIVKPAAARSAAHGALDKPAAQRAAHLRFPKQVPPQPPPAAQSEVSPTVLLPPPPAQSTASPAPASASTQATVPASTSAAAQTQAAAITSAQVPKLKPYSGRSAASLLAGKAKAAASKGSEPGSGPVQLTAQAVPLVQPLSAAGSNRPAMLVRVASTEVREVQSAGGPTVTLPMDLTPGNAGNAIPGSVPRGVAQPVRQGAEPVAQTPAASVEPAATLASAKPGQAKRQPLWAAAKPEDPPSAHPVGQGNIRHNHPVASAKQLAGRLEQPAPDDLQKADLSQAPATAATQASASRTALSAVPHSGTAPGQLGKTPEAGPATSSSRQDSPGSTVKSSSAVGNHAQQKEGNPRLGAGTRDLHPSQTPAKAQVAAAASEAAVAGRTAGLQPSLPRIPFAAFGNASPDEDDFFGKASGNAGSSALLMIGVERYHVKDLVQQCTPHGCQQNIL